MTQTIDPIKLKAAAEHLEWVLKQYPDSEDVQSLLRALTPLIEDAKAGRVPEPVDSMKIPGAWNFSDGRYITYEDPSVDSAYVAFVIEMEGGLSEQEKQLNARMDAMRKTGMEGSQP
jgi:vacuolar-type H+-ATPase subunit E/Vma4